MLEFDEVATGERTPGLLQAATRRDTAEPYRREAETRGLLKRTRGSTTTKLGDFVGECIWTTPAAHDHFMAPGQRLSRECERDSAGADRSKFHAPLVSFEIIDCPGRSRRHEISRHPPFEGRKVQLFAGLP